MGAEYRPLGLPRSVLGRKRYETKDLEIDYFIYLFLVAIGELLVPYSDIESSPPALGVQSLDHWTTSDVLITFVNAYPLCLDFLFCPKHIPELTACQMISRK